MPETQPFAVGGKGRTDALLRRTTAAALPGGSSLVLVGRSCEIRPRAPGGRKPNESSAGQATGRRLVQLADAR